MANGCVNERKYDSYEDRSSNKQPLLGPVKVFTCKYCGRKFLNSRALGGHQNAHKKERTIWMTSGMSNGKSLAMEPHSLLRKPLQEGLLATGKDLQSCRRIGDSWRKQIFKEVADPDLGWPGSFHVYSSGSEAISASYAGKRVMEESSGGDVLDLVLSQQPDQSNVQGLDLDLHL